MKVHVLLLALAPLALGGCVIHEPIPTRTTTITAPTRTNEVYVTRTPPPLRVESQTLSPGANYVWTRGYWRWTGTNYIWLPGRWIVRPRPTAVWVEGHWERRSAGWIWIAGHWR
jgi:WXXGXW repeat (2 copies)